jgi:hypothetical protein
MLDEAFLKLQKIFISELFFVIFTTHSELYSFLSYLQPTMNYIFDHLKNRTNH